MEHPYIEIGGIKWATMNVGAKNVTDSGLYFQWGDTQGYMREQLGDPDNNLKYFDWAHYKWTRQNLLLKYNRIDYKAVLDLEDDAVHAAWGGNWRMPTAEEFAKLSGAVNTEWVDFEASEASGLLCISKTDASKRLFFPACGYLGQNQVFSERHCHYWTNSSNEYNHLSSYSMTYNGGLITLEECYYRYCGFLLRGVLDE